MERSQSKNKQTFLAMGALVLIVVCTVSILASMRPPKEDPRPRMFYSNDDGKTVFEDVVGRAVPFDHDGQQAVRAYVFTPDQGQTRVVGFLERYTDELRDQLVEAGDDLSKQASIMSQAGPAAILIKRPGDSTWVNGEDPRAMTIRQGVSAGGKPLQPVIPGETPSADDR